MKNMYRIKAEHYGTYFITSIYNADAYAVEYKHNYTTNESFLLCEYTAEIFTPDRIRNWSEYFED